MKKICMVLMAVAITAVVQGSVVFNDTYQAPNNSAINDNLATRQSAGSVSASYFFTEAGRAENEVKIKDRNSNGESAMGITTYSQLNGDSWGAVRLSPDFSPQLAGKKYSVTLDAQFGIVTGTTVNDFWLGLGILGVGEAAQVPTSSNTDFGIRINASGGGYGIYSDGSSVSNATTGSTLTFNERFELTLNVDETSATPSVQVLLQGIGDPTATDLGTYGFNVDAGETARSINLRVNQTNTSGSGSDNGVLYLDTYDMSVEVIPEPASLGLVAVASAGLLIARRLHGIFD